MQTRTRFIYTEQQFNDNLLCEQSSDIFFQKKNESQTGRCEYVRGFFLSQSSR